jgi:teichuronic acid biosynthesis glycosyltransferase TuaC
LRVAFVTTSYPAFEGDPSGHFVETEVKRAAAFDEVFVVTAGENADSAARRIEHGATVLRLPGRGAFGWPGVAARVSERPTRGLGAALWTANAARVLATLRPLDRVVAHWAVPSAWPVARQLGAPVELVSHGADVRLLVALPRPLRIAVVDRLLRQARVWRFVSSSLWLELTRSLDSRSAVGVERIARVEPCAIELPDVAHAAREKRRMGAGAKLAVCVGRLVESKRVDRVIDFVAEDPRGVRLVVVGTGPLLTALKKYAVARGVDATFVGKATRHEALAWMAAADVVLHASVAEGCSTVEREAEALGVPWRFVGPVSVPSNLR